MRIACGTWSPVPAFVVDRAESEHGMCLVLLTLLVAIQRVGMAVSVYHVDCGKIARRSCCD